MAHWKIQPSRQVGYVELRLSPADGARELIEIGLRPDQAAELGRDLVEIAATFRAAGTFSETGEQVWI